MFHWVATKGIILFSVAFNLQWIGWWEDSKEKDSSNDLGIVKTASSSLLQPAIASQ